VPHDAPSRLPTSLVVLLWIAALPLLMAGLGTPVVQRTQEARVLETAREMLDSRDWRQWLVPRLNGDVRLQKPPLAYWLAAGSFRIFGINDFAGRLPFVLAGWLTLAVVYRFARGLLDQRFALFAVAILLTSYMFFVHFRLAETDSVAGLFVSAAIYWLWKGASQPRRSQSFLSFHLAGLAIAMAVLSKGPPGVFPVFFFLAWVIVERNWAALRRSLFSGALLTTAVLAGWWFLYVRTSAFAHVLKDELFIVTGGEDHRQPFYMYFPQLLRASAPWTGLMILGVIFAIRDWRREPAARTALLWLAVILLPLCIIRNRQNHYLVPLTPALAMLAAYAVEKGLQIGTRDAKAANWVVGVTIGFSFLSPIGVYWFARQQNGFLQTQDLVVIILLFAAVLAAASMGRRNGLAAAVACYAAGLSLCLAVMFGRWLPSLHRVTHRTIAADLREAFPEGGYRFYGRDPSFPLIWNLRQVVPTVDSEEALNRTLAEAPQIVVIAQTKNNRPPPPIPPQLKQVREFESGDEGMTFRIYRLSQ